MKMKKLKELVAIFTIFMMTIMCIPTMAAEQITNNQLKIHYINVGQGDSTLIQVDGKNVLIDAGNNDNLAYNYLKAQGITKLDYVIATHPHADHIGGMANIINNFTVGKFYAPKEITTTTVFENMVKSLQSKRLKITVPTPGENIYIGNAVLTFLAPNNSTYEDLNNYSIVTKIKYGNTSFIFEGDAEDISENEILAKQLDISANVIKIGHHGSSSSTTKAYLDKVNPQYAVISVGANNDYGHPNKDILDRLTAKNIKVFRTDISGNIIANSNGTSITFNSSPMTGNPGTVVNSNNTNTINNNSNTTTVNKNKSMTVWRANSTTKVYHLDKTCSGMKNPTSMTLEEAEQIGLRPCSKCAK